MFDAGVAGQVQNRLAVLLERLPGQDLSEKVRGVMLGTYVHKRRQRQRRAARASETFYGRCGVSSEPM